MMSQEMIELTLYVVPVSHYAGRYSFADGCDLEKKYPAGIYFVVAPSGRIIEVAGEMTERMKEIFGDEH